LIAHAVRRLGAAALTAALVAVITFMLVHLAPGDPMVADAERLHADPARVAALRARFGLDRPLPEQLARYVANAARGDLGESFVEHRSVATLIAERLPNTLLLGGAALVLGFALGIGIALLQAARAGSRADAALSALTVVAWSTPA